MNKINCTLLLCLISVMAFSGTKNDSLRIVFGLSGGRQMTKINYNFGLKIQDHSKDKNYWDNNIGLYLGVKPGRNLITSISFNSTNAYFESVSKKAFSGDLPVFIAHSFKLKSIGIGVGYIYTYQKLLLEATGNFVKTFVMDASSYIYPTLNFYSFKVETLVGLNLHHHVLGLNLFISGSLDRQMNVIPSYYNSTVSFVKSYGFNLTYRFYFLKK